MKTLFLLLITMNFALADESRCSDVKDKVNCLCQAPNQSFLESKLKESFILNDGEQELREIVTTPENYEIREQLKSLHRRLYFANRLEKGALLQDMSNGFEKMIAGAKRGRSIANFPMEGSTSEISSGGGALILTVKDLSREELTFFPKEILDKLGNTVHIHYRYPIDRFDYFVSYEGKEVPMKKAFFKMQDEFENFCYARASENQDIRSAIKKERQKRYGTGVTDQ